MTSQQLNTPDGEPSGRQAGGWMPIDKAVETVLADSPEVTGTECIPLDAAGGRVLAQTLISPMDVPGSTLSAMDGFAVLATEAEVGAVLAVRQRIAAGEVGGPLAPGEAARVFTGAPLPAGADAVIMQEDCERLGDNDIRVSTVVGAGDNIRRAGEDISAGTTVFQAGRRLLPQDVGLLAALGLGQVTVRRRPRVALLLTGKELVMPGKPLAAGQIYDSNRFALAALLDRLPVQVVKRAAVADSPSATRAALREARNSCDCVITSGGVSVGEEDHVRDAVTAEGVLTLWKLAIKPGKPFAFGRVGECRFLGLPGNPVSAFVTFCLLARPALLAMAGDAQPLPRWLPLPAGFSRAAAGTRQEYLRVTVESRGSGRVALVPFGNQGSGIAASLSGSDGLAVLPAGKSVAMGDDLDYLPFSAFA